MWLVYDWQAAVVIDQVGQIIDDIQVQGILSTRDILQRLSDLQNNQPTPEALELHHRFSDAQMCQKHEPNLPLFALPEPSIENVEQFDKALILQTKMEIEFGAGHPDRRLEHLVRLSDELRSSQLTLENRCIEWFGDMFPYAQRKRDRHEFLRKASTHEEMATFCESIGIELPQHNMPSKEWNLMRTSAQHVLDLKAEIDRVEQALRMLSNEYLPSVSVLLGPLLAARMCVEAHGRERLSKLPSGTIQVLGAEKAFFHHLKTGSPPPKHGHIFMHPWISHSPKWVRGKISRMLASKVSIAAKIDAFQGEAWTEKDVEKIGKRVEVLRSAKRKKNQK